jgi:hypothetical protein
MNHAINYSGFYDLIKNSPEKKREKRTSRNSAEEDLRIEEKNSDHTGLRDNTYQDTP